MLLRARNPSTCQLEITTQAEECSGTGDQESHNHNKSLLMKCLWGFNIEEQALWSRVIVVKYDLKVIGALNHQKHLWRSIRNLWPEFKQLTSVGVGNNNKTVFW